MGLEDYLLASVLRGVVAQRLVRCLCRACREPYTAPPALVVQSGLAVQGDDAITLHRAVGCAQCSGTGYRGRTAIAELLVIDDRLRQLILARGEPQALLATARAAGMVELRQDGLAKAVAGITSLEEVMRVTGEA